MVAPHDYDTVALPKKDLYGSKLRFLMLTSEPKDQIAKTLTRLASPWASVDPLRNHWMPKGFSDSAEAELANCAHFLSDGDRRELTRWWLAKVRANTSTPNWDLVSTCSVDGQPGIILIEGKAHAGELEEEGKRAGGNEDNHRQIQCAIEQANKALNQIIPGWNLCRDSHYQLCNRFAWAWKVAALGWPTILIYLGFLNATEMERRGEPFVSPEDWNKTMREHAANIVPPEAWESRLQTSGAPLWAFIRSLDHQWCVGR